VAPIIAGSPWNGAALCETFNVGSNRTTSLNELTRLVSAAMEADDHPVRHVPARNESILAFADHTKVRRVFSPGAEMELEEGLRRMARWARERGIERASVAPEIEVGAGLPEAWTRPPATPPSMRQILHP
jgi:nucleoside-diphosphate-sugar epimerase